MIIRKNYVRVHVVRKTANGFEPVTDYLNASKSVEKALKETRQNTKFRGCLVYGEKVRVTINLDIEQAIQNEFAFIVDEKPVDETDETEEAEETEETEE